MEDSKVALDSFMNSQSESVNSQIKVTDSTQVQAVYEAWERDFKSSSNIFPTVTCNDHQSHDLPVAEEEDELEQITLDSCIQQNTNEILIRMGNNLKVDNFYVDGESEQLDELEFSGYMPSGVNNSALFDEAEALAGCDECEDDEEGNTPEDATLNAIHIQDTDDSSSLQAFSLTPQKDEHNHKQEPTETLTLSAANMTLLQQAYQTDQSRLIETLSCSESSVEDNERTEDDKNGEITADFAAISSEESAMVEALKAFQEFSPRYRDIQSSELLHAMNNGNHVNIEGDMNTVEVTRWYDDVEEFVQD
eukprot:gene7847-9356_t